MVVPRDAAPAGCGAEQFRADWLLAAVLIHAVLSIGFGLVYGWCCRGCGPSRAAGLGRPGHAPAVDRDELRADGRRQPGAPERVDWPWFIVSQFVFGMVAAMVVLRRRWCTSRQRAGTRRRLRSRDKAVERMTKSRQRILKFVIALRRKSGLPVCLAIAALLSLVATNCPASPTRPTEPLRRMLWLISTGALRPRPGQPADDHQRHSRLLQDRSGQDRLDPPEFDLRDMLDDAGKRAGGPRPHKAARSRLPRRSETVPESWSATGRMPRC